MARWCKNVKHRSRVWPSRGWLQAGLMVANVEPMAAVVDVMPGPVA